MGRISDTFDRLAANGQKALIIYMMAGYPDAETTISAVRGALRGGADIIELGFPFSDPLADGPIIQEAATQSIRCGTTLRSYYNMVKQIREFSDVPLITMTYANVAYNAGFDKFFMDAASAGINGMILPDMPIEEADAYRHHAQLAGLDTVFLASPNTTAERAARIAKASAGFVYMVAVYGTTGSRVGIQEHTIQALRRIKSASDGLPVGVGFGISRPADVRLYIKAGADAVIVGSAVLDIIRNAEDHTEQAVAGFVQSLKKQTSVAL